MGTYELEDSALRLNLYSKKILVRCWHTLVGWISPDACVGLKFEHWLRATLSFCG